MPQSAAPVYDHGVALEAMMPAIKSNSGIAAGHGVRNAQTSRFKGVARLLPTTNLTVVRYRNHAPVRSHCWTSVVELLRKGGGDNCTASCIPLPADIQGEVGFSEAAGHGRPLGSIGVRTPHLFTRVSASRRPRGCFSKKLRQCTRRRPTPGSRRVPTIDFGAASPTGAGAAPKSSVPIPEVQTSSS
jgi:hypothetical protein